MSKRLSLRFLLGLLFETVFGCTPHPTTAFPSSEDQSAETDLPAAEMHWVSDASERYVFAVPSVGRPVRSREEGYLHVQGKSRELGSYNCFVYEGSKLPGVAMTRLFSSLESGIEFETTELTGLESTDETPLLLFEARYGARPPGPDAGRIHVGFAVRRDFPVVCIGEKRDGAASFVSFMRDLTRSFRSAQSEFAADELVEIWKTNDQEGRPGLSFLIARVEEGHFVSIQSSSSFGGGRRLETRDAVRWEVSDHAGLLRSMSSAHSGDREQMRVVLARRDEPAPSAGAVRYHYQGHFQREASEGDFETERALSGLAAYFRWLEGKSEVAHSLSYVPSLRRDGAVFVEQTRVSPTVIETAGPGESRSRLQLSEGGLPSVSTSLDESRPLSSSLLLRHGSPFQLLKQWDESDVGESDQSEPGESKPGESDQSMSGSPQDSSASER